MSFLSATLRRRAAAGARSFVRNQSSSTAAAAYKSLHRSKAPPPLPTLDTPTWSADSAVSSILYETYPTPSSDKDRPTDHVLMCLVQNEPGVLSRVSGILAARGFNIDSLVVCKTEVENLSRMTIVIRGPEGVVEQARRQVEDLIPVWAVLDYTNTDIIKRELLLARVSLLGPEYFEDLLHHHYDAANGTQTVSPASQKEFHPNNLAPSEALRHRHQHLRAITNLVSQFGGKVVDISDRNCVVELSAKPTRVSSFLALLQPFGVLEVARSGMMALPRAQFAGAEKNNDPSKSEADVVDASHLPPG